MKKLKSKILAGLIFLLSVILIISITGIISIYYLSEDSKAILKDNYASVGYTSNMISSLDNIFDSFVSSSGTDSIAKWKDQFDKYFRLQKNNITEKGEQELVKRLEINYTRFLFLIDSISINKTKPATEDVISIKTIYSQTSVIIKAIYELNMEAIYRKNSTANKTADNVTIMMALTAASSILLTVIFILYFPAYITSPLKELTQKIDDISNKKYDQHINIHSNDELSLLASAFNKMTAKLKEYEAQHLDELLLEKRKMETLVTNLQDGTLLLDSNFKILHANKKFCELTELSLDKLLDKSITELDNSNEIISAISEINVKDPDAALKQKLKPLRKLLNNQPEYYQILLLDISKSTHTEIRNEPGGYILLVQNITRYEERDLAKTNLLATISHELKTPISSINLSLKLLSDIRIGELNEEQEQLVNSIKLQSTRILSLVNEVLDYTQVETGHLKFKITPCPVADLIELSTFAVLMLLNEKEIELDTVIAKNLPDVKCDVEKTVWVLVNLLNNAIRYSALKGKIMISVSLQDKFILFSIKDFGSGINPDEQKNIFEKYVKSKSGSSKGSGLGLAIAKEFVEVQGGTINVESTPGKGSTFYFTLPIV